MNVNLQNAYVEVLLDNFLSVVKQNIMLQANLEVQKSNNEELESNRIKVKELSEQNLSLQESIQILNLKLTSSIGPDVDISNIESHISSIKQENIRLQKAVNEYMRQISHYQEGQDVASSRAEMMNKYIEALEQVVPPSKIKKIKDDLNPKQTTKPDDNTKNGGSF